MVCQFLLYNKVNQLYIYIYRHISSFLCLPPIIPTPPLQVVTKHRADLPVLCGCFPLAICLHLVVYTCPCHSLTFSQLTLPPPCVLKSILYIWSLFLSSPQILQKLFFFFFNSMYMCQHTVFVFLFLTYFTLYDRLQVDPPHYK